MQASTASCFASLLLVVLFANLVVGQEDGTFDVTKYGAVADGKTDNKNAFLDAWRDSCAYKGKSTFVVPVGTFLLGRIVFEGHCFNNRGTNIDIKGTVVSNVDLNDISKYGWIEFNHLHQIFIGGGGTLDGQGAKAWPLKSSCPKHIKCKNLPTSLRFNGVNNATVSDLRIVNSMGFHVNLHRSANIQVKRLSITAPAESPNTDGIHISAANNINITDTDIGTGDDCISVGPGATNVLVYKVSCGPGHGISVGSLGKYQHEKDVSGVTVKNCSLSNTTNGLRLKTWPGSPASKALNFIFEDVRVSNVSNPIIIDQEYCPKHHCKDEPSGVKIANVRFTRIQGTSKTPVAVSLRCSKAVPCDDVKLQDIKLIPTEGDEPTTSSCCNVDASYLGAQLPSPC